MSVHTVSAAVQAKALGTLANFDATPENAATLMPLYPHVKNAMAAHERDGNFQARALSFLANLAYVYTVARVLVWGRCGRA